MRRREFIAGISAVAAARPLVARAQQGERVRRLGVLMGWDESDPQAKAGLSGFAEGLGKLGWTDGRNLRVDIRWASGNADRMRMFAKELVELQPDVILANTTPVTAAFQRQARTIPIVFVIVSDPVGAGLVASLPHPGGNITGFINMEGAIGGQVAGAADGDRAPRQAGRYLV
jgi:putative tryptophan/tyrosine transport system substrate-binding protein